MRILQLTPGTGNFFCGSCLRDNSLVHGLRAKGHDVLMVPLYLPLVTDEAPEDQNLPIFMSGISVFLQQKFSSFRHAPNWVNRILSAPLLLKGAANLAGMTSARELGESAVAMLEGGERRQAGEAERLIEFLRHQHRPEIVSLSNSLLGGLSRRLKEEFKVPIVSSMQGEDSFLDALPEPYRAKCWDLLKARCAEIDHFIVLSEYYGQFMRERLNLPANKLTVIYPGIAAQDFTPAPEPPKQPVIAFLARMHPWKGLDTLINAYLKVRERGRVPGVRLRIAGAKVGPDHRFVDGLKAQLGAAEKDVEFLPNLDRDAKVKFLREATVLSVPATYGEAFGLYLLEAWATGVPVVQPRHGAFPELIAKTGGGVLCEPNDPNSLAEAVERVLLDPAKARMLGQAGRKAVEHHFTVEAMSEKTEALFRKLTNAA